jgi:hypothetical protein
MADNTTLPPGVGGDTFRTLDKTGTGTPKTEVFALDVAGGDGRGENILTFPVPTSLPDVPVDDDGGTSVSLSPATTDALEVLFRQLMAAVGPPTGIPSQPLAVSVGVASVLVAAANPVRKGMVITNTSASGQVISLGLGAPAVAGSGIVLQSNNWWWMDRNGFTAGAINAIASAASGTLAVQEFN